MGISTQSHEGELRYTGMEASDHCNGQTGSSDQQEQWRKNKMVINRHAHILNDIGARPGFTNPPIVVPTRVKLSVIGRPGDGGRNTLTVVQLGALHVRQKFALFLKFPHNIFINKPTGLSSAADMTPPRDITVRITKKKSYGSDRIFMYRTCVCSFTYSYT